jgi:hypothetical protein
MANIDCRMVKQGRDDESSIRVFPDNCQTSVAAQHFTESLPLCYQLKWLEAGSEKNDEGGEEDGE